MVVQTPQGDLKEQETVGQPVAALTAERWSLAIPTSIARVARLSKKVALVFR
jgi:hypothetical protein